MLVVLQIKFSYLNVISKGFKCNSFILYQCLYSRFVHNQWQYHHLHNPKKHSTNQNSVINVERGIWVHLGHDIKVAMWMWLRAHQLYLTTILWNIKNHGVTTIKTLQQLIKGGYKKRQANLTHLTVSICYQDCIPNFIFCF